MKWFESLLISLMLLGLIVFGYATIRVLTAEESPSDNGPQPVNAPEVPGELGFGTPESTLRRFLKAAAQGDEAGMRQCLLIGQSISGQMTVEPGEVPQLGPAKKVSETEVQIEVSWAGVPANAPAIAGAPFPYVLVRVGAEWKIDIDKSTRLFAERLGD